MTRATLLKRLMAGVFIATAVAVATLVQVNAQGVPGSSARDRVLKNRSCDGCDLTGVDLSRADLKGVSLAGAKLAGASFYKSDLTSAYFGGADLSKAVLTFANLSNANLSNANLSGANLVGVVGADLSAAKTDASTVCPDSTAGPCR